MAGLLIVGKRSIMKVSNYESSKPSKLSAPKCNLWNIVEFILLDISDIVRYLGPTHPSLTSVLYHVICYSLYPGTIIAYPEEGEEWSSPHFSLKGFNLRKHFVHRHLLWRLLSLWKESEWWMGGWEGERLSTLWLDQNNPHIFIFT